MSLMDFKDLCTSLCELVGAQAPDLVPDSNGTLAFTVTVDDVDTGVVLDDSGPEPGALLVTVLGTPEEAGELQLLRGLLDTNFIVSGVGAPSFVRNPVTGEIALHQPLLLSQVTAQDVYDKVVRATGTMARWKAGLFAEEGQPQS